MDWPIYMDWPLLLPNNECLELPQVLRFSEFVAMHHSLLVALTADPPEPELPPSWLQPYLLHWLRLHNEQTNFAGGVVFVENVFAWSAQGAAGTSAHAAHLLKKYNQAKLAMRESNYLDSAEVGKKKMLTAISVSANLISVKSPLAQLLDRLNQATAVKGEKAKLAEYLKAPRPCVSDWLSGKREPSGETTLRLLQWVEEQEREQKKSPGA
ncbi:MAG: hypothetical protein NT154_07480 [Verrucomicrobia bacterium]|nr:hypothetical protein [Verrucomicrobiota bacterium]